ncbi:MAG: hypothetical protein RMI50_01265 [Aquificaceae bacterium]|nr:hypothetical protein [Aquificaceae bacterium]
MGVLCLLLDKKKQYASLLADIFNVTGHRLLIALSEEKAFDLLQVTSPEVILLTVEDLHFWFKILDVGKYISPIFFVESEEDTEKLRRYGLREFNWIVLPFNPIELLTKMVSISKIPKEPAHLEAIGPISVLLGALRMGVSAYLTIQGESSSCSLIIREGTIEGADCHTEAFIKLLGEDVKVKLMPLEGESLSVIWAVRDNRDFFERLFYQRTRTVVEQEEKIVPALVHAAVEQKADLSQPIQLDEDFYWVGVEDTRGLFQKNAYLRIYSKDSIRVPLLINLGTEQDYIIIRTKLEQIVGSISAVRGLILMGSGVDEASGVLSFLQANQKAFVITSMSIAHKLNAMGIPKARIKTVESFPRGMLKLATGDILKFLPMPFLPEAGSYAVLEEGRGYLFTGRFLSSLCSPEEFNPLRSVDLKDVFLYTGHIIPSGEAVKSFIKRLEGQRVFSVHPMLGNPLLSQEDIRLILTELDKFVVREDAYSLDEELLLQACESLIGLLRVNLEDAEWESLMEDLNPFIYMEDGKITRIFVEAQGLPSLILGIMYSKNIKPRILKEAINHFYSMGIPIAL